MAHVRQKIALGSGRRLRDIFRLRQLFGLLQTLLVELRVVDRDRQLASENMHKLQLFLSDFAFLGCRQ